MEVDKVAELFVNMCILKERFKASALSEDEKLFLQWLEKAIGSVEENVISHFLNLCKDYNRICTNTAITVDGTFTDSTNSVSKEDIGIAAGVGMASQGIFDGIVGQEQAIQQEINQIQEEVEDLYLSDEEFLNLTSELDII